MSSTLSNFGGFILESAYKGILRIYEAMHRRVNIAGDGSI